MRRCISLIQRGNGGKDNPVLSVVPQGGRFSGGYISAHIMKRNAVTKLEWGESLLIYCLCKKNPQIALLWEENHYIHYNSQRVSV